MSLLAAPIFSLASATSPLKQQQQHGVGSIVPGIPLFAGLVPKHGNGCLLKSAGLRAQSRWVCMVAAGTASSSAEHGSEEEDDDDDDWETELFEGFSRPPSGIYGGRRIGDWDDEGESNSAREEASQGDWSVKARERAIRAIEERELPVGALLDDGGKKKRRKKKKKKAPSPEMRLTKSKLERLEKIAKDLDEKGLLTGDDRLKESLMENPFMKAVGSGEGFEALAGLGNYWKSLGNSTSGETRAADGVNQEKGESKGFSSRIVIPTPKNAENSGGSRVYSAPSKQKRQEDFDLNRKLVAAADAEEVLSVVGDVLEDRMWGEEGPLSPFNVSTALHRIAKHMETVFMHKSDRLAFARQKVMAQLVSGAIEALPNCSAQSISNIAWALSKVGGYSLYWTEMDLLAEVAITKLTDLEPQHIANIAGAFASMQHSIPRLFEALERRASLCYREFQSQELAQLVWAFATLNQPARSLLDSLDSDCQTLQKTVETIDTIDFPPTEEDDMLPLYLSDSFLTAEVRNSKVGLDSNQEAEIPKGKQWSKWSSAKNYLETFSVSELASLSWSYTVLDQLGRPSFSLIWQAIMDKGVGIRSSVKELPNPGLQLSQLHQTKLSLQLEYPHLDLSLGEPLDNLALLEWETRKNGFTATSVTQLNVERLLVGTGRRWVAEYTDADYSLDAALVEEKICLEIDGPSHFARNTGTPLGHTMLKRRQLGAAGWTVLSIPYQEWDDQVGEQEQRLYLRNLLRDHL
ncbi:unnamed protein product [Calypogeia fissa]